MFKKTIFIFLFSLTTYLLAQDIDYARKVIDTLCSPTMHGRGYTQRGHLKAARYISREYKRHGLLMFNMTYYQPFNIDVNTFPGDMVMTIDGKVMYPGRDFQIHPGSAGIDGDYQVLHISEAELLDSLVREQVLTQGNFKGKVVCLHYSEANASTLTEILEPFKQRARAAAYIVPVFKKLTWHVKTLPIDYTEIQLVSKHFSHFGKVYFNIDSEFCSKMETNNVIGYIEGSEQPDSFYVFSAHYDHLGGMGKNTYIPGANDNASGIAMLLNLMQHFRQYRPRYSVAFIAFGGEELGLLGSRHYVEQPFFPLSRIKFLINLDIVGTGEEGITVVNGTEFEKAFDKLTLINARSKLLPQIKTRGTAANSDHYPFYQKHVPCFFIYTMGGIKAYHDIDDRAQTLPLTEFPDLMNLLLEFAQ